MGRFLGGILFISITSAQPLPNLGFGSANAGFAWFGPKTIYAGFTSYFSFPTTRWRVPVTCSATGNTCDTSGSGYTPTGNETTVYVSATTLPTGMESTATGVLAPYDICNVSGTQFKLCHTGTSTVEAFSSTGTGVSILFVPASGVTHSYVISNTGWPAGTVLTWGWSNFGSGWLQDAPISPNGNPYNYNNAQSMILRVTIPTGATLGDTTIAITTCTIDGTAGSCGGGASDTVTFIATVAAAIPPSDANEVTSFPAIPGLSTWVSKMTSSGNGGGGDFCDPTTGATSPADQTAALIGAYVQYYDGGLNYLRVANYLGDPRYLKCTENILQQIAWGNANSTANPHGYILPNHGNVLGFQAFPIGYEKAINQDPRYVGVLQNYAALMQGIGGGGFGLSYLTTGCNPKDNQLREDAYALNVMLTIDRLGLATADPNYTGVNDVWSARRQRCVDELIDMMDAYTNGTKRFTQNQYFITYYGIDALIHWWQRTKDPRVPIVVKKMNDQYYSDYNISLHQGMWDPEPVGPRCINGPLWFRPDVDDHCQDNTGANLGELHNLISHAFAWYWRISGDDTYRTEGDEIFSHSITCNGTGFNCGKTWSTNYRYSFNYVGWRQGWLSPDKSIE